MRVTIEFDWEELGEITLSPDGKFVIPSVSTEPGVYRFRVPASSSVEGYIGQTNDLRRHMGNYAGTYSGTTATRIRNGLLAHLAAGKRVQHGIVRQARLDIDGESADVNLALGHVRLLIENAALALAHHAGEKAHNLDRLIGEAPAG